MYRLFYVFRVSSVSRRIYSISHPSSVSSVLCRLYSISHIFHVSGISLFPDSQILSRLPIIFRNLSSPDLRWEVLGKIQCNYINRVAHHTLYLLKGKAKISSMNILNCIYDLINQSKIQDVLLFLYTLYFSECLLPLFLRWQILRQDLGLRQYLKVW